MASTRRVNNKGDYEIEQLSNLNKVNYLTTSEYGFPSETHLPGNGLLQGRVGGLKVASNYCDIESDLFGIGSTNLVEEKDKVVPDIYQVKSLNVSHKMPLIMPESFIVKSNQRPNIQN